MRIRIAPGFWTSRVGLAILGAALLGFLTATAVFAYYYIQFGKLIDQRLTGQVFQNTSRVFSAPGHIYVGETMRPGDLATYLLRAGYQEGDAEGAPGTFKVKGSTVEVRPSAASYFRAVNALKVDFSAGKISRISQLSDGAPSDSAEIEPELITNLFDSSREKRRVVRFDDLPKDLVDAVLAAEDKRFFEHGGLDIVRVFGAALADLRRGQKAQGASTIDMQVARSFFFTTKREWRRKVKEVLMAVGDQPALFQTADFRAVCQRSLSRQSRQFFHPRIRRGRRSLFRQGRPRAHPRRMLLSSPELFAHPIATPPPSATWTAPKNRATACCRKWSKTVTSRRNKPTPPKS